MTASEIYSQLQNIELAPHFAERTEMLVNEWLSSNIGIESVEATLRFMEEHPTIDFGMPGALTHFMERFYQRGYEEKLLESISRRPTSHTVWLLNRVINGAKSEDIRQRFVTAMERAKSNSAADKDTLGRIDHFLSRIESKGYRQ
jgi:hypothetical protein